MNNALFNLDRPQNEHTLTYAPGCRERKGLNGELDRLSAEVQDIPLIIGGKEVRTGKTGTVVIAALGGIGAGSSFTWAAE